MKKSVKVIRIIVFSIILMIFMCAVSDTIAKYGDAVIIRNMLYHILPIILFAYILLIIILVINPKLAAPRVMILDVLSIVMFIVVLAICQKEVSIETELGKAFVGNNYYASFYSNGIGGYIGYDDMEKCLEDKIAYVKETGNHDEYEEIYRIQMGEKIFVYFKVDEEAIAEFDFYKQDELYYCLGYMLLHNWAGYSDSWTAEDTIKKDIAYTMRREGVRKLEGAPAWGVSTDERISSMTINAEPVDDVILINEMDGKKYYFWIITNVGEIKTIKDVITAEIEMNSL